jgi:uncharacterized protein involved in exopolysaccharide biosynthesis
MSRTFVFASKSAGERPAATGLAARLAAWRRRRGPAVRVAATVLLLAVAIVAIWPASYRSTGTILIEQQELPADLVQSMITSYADQRIQVISQRVMTTDNLLRIVGRYNLYPRLRRIEPREVVLEHMRHDISLEMISADVMDPRQGRATKANIAFKLGYNSHSPETAAQVANELVSLYLDENVKSRRQQTEEAENFLNEEADRLDGHIKQLEATLAAFRDQHIHTLPDQAIFNREELARVEDEIRAADTQLRSLDQQSTFLDAQLAQLSPTSQVYTSSGERVLSPADRLKYLRTEYARVSGIYASNHPDVVRLKAEIEGLEHAAGPVDSSNDLRRQLQDARTRLAQLQQRYGPAYPDVVALQDQIETLNRSLEASSAAASPTTHDAGSSPAGTDAHADNPAYIQLESQREGTQAARDSLLQQRVSLQRKLAELEGQLAAAPAVQRDFDSLVRELDNEEIKYREVRQKQMAAKVSENLEDQQKGERFTLIDPPLTPEEPASPNRPLWFSLGLILALASAVGTVALLENHDDSVRDRDDLEALLQVPPLAILPLVKTRADVARDRKQRRYVLAGTVGACALALVLTHLLYRPLDVLWDIALRRIGG